VLVAASATTAVCSVLVLLSFLVVLASNVPRYRDKYHQAVQLASAQALQRSFAHGVV
jgi:hypothetical protein